MADGKSDIVIKKVKKGGHAPHGGAWKVAYADFVTAMMAFFLLLWLLTATPVENLKGLADYFTPTMGLQGKMGIGFRGGMAPNDIGVSSGDWASMGLVFGSPPSGPIIKMPEQDNKIDEDNDQVTFNKVEQDISKAVEESEGLGPFRDSILIEQTPEGLNINIVDRQRRSMFEKDSAVLRDQAKAILGKISQIVKHIPNYIQIVGHSGSDFIPESPEYTAWELSADRANSARRYLLSIGIEREQIARIVAKADQDPFNRDNLQDPANSRVTVTLLRKSILAYHKQPAPEEILLEPDKAGLGTFIKEEEKRQDKRERLKEIISGGTTDKGAAADILDAEEAEAAAKAAEAAEAAKEAENGDGEASEPLPIKEPAPAENPVVEEQEEDGSEATTEQDPVEEFVQEPVEEEGAVEDAAPLTPEESADALN